MKDLFSGHAADYAKYRPTYPPALFEFLAAQCAERRLAWDCATGNGQAALGLAPYFEQVVGTDLSARQLQQAPPCSNVVYREATAEASGFDAWSVDLVTVAQALHWFDLDRFHGEVRRVTKPGGVVAVWCYALAEITPEIDRVVRDYYDNVIGKYWEPERRLVVEGYATLPFPFDRIATPPFEMTAEWNLAQCVSYLNTWSATQAAIQALGRNPLDEFSTRLAEVWGDPEQPRRIAWPLFVHVGKLESRL